MRIAIVTGASSGLGREFVRQIAARGDVEAIWAVARREDRLRGLGAGSPVPILPIPLDLTLPESFSLLGARLKKERPDVRILVNAAGFAKMGDFSEVALRDATDMIELNCSALVRMTACAVPYVGRGGRILELCSVAGFMPLPGLNVYAASKAFALSYSRALRRELAGRGVGVTAVCPYWVTDTEFIGVAREGGNPQAVRRFVFGSSARRVVRAALRAGARNRAVSTPGPVAVFLRLCSKLLPDAWIIAGWELLRRL